MDQTPSKVCARCKRELPATTEYFPPRNRPGRRDRCGVDCYCRPCTNERAKERYSRNRERIRARTKELRAQNADRIRQQKRESRQRNIEHVQAKQREYNETHRKEKLAYQKEYAKAHPEQIAEYRRAHYQKNSDAIKAKAHAWHKQNPDRVKERTARRRSRMKNAPGHFTTDDLKRQREAQDGKCFYCSDPLDGLGTVDHFIPLSKGGTNFPENIVLACWDCNNRKRAMMPDEFLKILPTVRETIGAAG